MATAINTLVLRGPRRVRLLFTGALAAGAFTSTSYYAAANSSNSLAPPLFVEAVFAIANTPNGVEVSLSQDFVPGDLYTFTVTAVPTVDGSNPSGSVQVTVPQPLQSATNTEPATSDIDLVLYGEDLYFNGADIVEDSTGDLATLSGSDNWVTAIQRRMMSYGIKWDPSYGPKSYEYVDAPQPYQLPFAGALVAQAKADNRTAQCTVTVAPAPLDPGGFVFQLTITGRDGLQPQTFSVPPPQNLAP